MVKQVTKKLSSNTLFRSANDLICGYNLTASFGKEQVKATQKGTGRKVYLIGRPLKSGNVSLVRYSFTNGERQRESTGKVLRVELDAVIKASNQEIVRQERAMCDSIENDLQMSGSDFVASTRGQVMLSDFLCPDTEKKTSQMDSVERLMKSLVGHVKAFGDVRVCDVSESWVRGFLEYLKNDAVRLSVKDRSKAQKLSQNTQNKCLVVLSVALNKAVKDKRLRKNPVDYLEHKERIKSKPSTRTFLDLEEVRKLVATECVGDAHGYDLKAAFLFSVNVGLRFSDVIKLRLCDFKKDENGTYIDITMEKTDEPLFTYVSDYALSLLPQVEDATKPIFRIPSNKTANYWLSEWVKAAGIEKHVTFHCSRHSCATLLLSNGMPLQNISALLGHANIQTTQIYAKLLNEARKETANKMDAIMGNL
jgi:integrase